MTLKIEAGKFYRTRDGRKVGPMNVPPKMKGWASVVVADTHDGISGLGFCGWCDGGRYFPNRDSVDDLIAEWTDEPDATDNDADGLAYQRQNTPKPYLVPFKPNQRLSLEPIANGGWIVSAASPYYVQETERLGAFGSAGDMLSALHDALTVRNGGNA